MIERLTMGLRRLASLSVRDLDDAAGARAIGDCADAVRLELDCPQQALTTRQRLALSRLSDQLEQPESSRTELVAAARRACLALALTTLAADDGVPNAPADRC